MTKQKNKFVYYLLEILVVIIGISAAFALDRWGSANKESELETNYKNSLVADLEKDIKDFKRIRDSTAIIISHISEVFQYNYNNRPLNAYKRHHATSNYLAIYFYPQNGTYVSLINSGDIAVIKDFELKTALSDLYNVKYKEIERTDEVIRNLADGIIQPYIIKNIEFDIMQDGLKSAKPLKTTEATNMIGSMYNLLSGRQMAYKKLIEHCEELKAKIQFE